MSQHDWLGQIRVPSFRHCFIGNTVWYSFEVPDSNLIMITDLGSFGIYASEEIMPPTKCRSKRTYSEPRAREILRLMGLRGVRTEDYYVRSCQEHRGFHIAKRETELHFREASANLQRGGKGPGRQGPARGGSMRLDSQTSSELRSDRKTLSSGDREDD